jgi:L-alanine-DL-glutamate epimerase-like enolase superfamily enzyme
MIRLDFHTDFLKFRYPFRIAHGERLGTDVVFVKLHMKDTIGFGEATLPPYLGVRTTDVLAAFARPGIVEAMELLQPEDWFQALSEVIPDNMPALAALDMARWQVHLKQNPGTLIKEESGIPMVGKVPHTFTLGVSDEKEMSEKLDFACQQGFELFKLKLNGKCDFEMLSAFRKLSKAPFAIDANQAWTKLEQALDLLNFLEAENCVLIEQPFHKSDRVFSNELRKRTVIPVVADEACQQFGDLEEVLQAFDGVNVKLQKCGGITPALQQLRMLKKRNKKALIGCMSESSIGCNAAEQLTSLCDWADLDGPYLNENNSKICQRLGYSW